MIYINDTRAQYDSIKEDLIPWPPERKIIDIGSVYSSYEKIKGALGWRPTVSLEEGLRKTIEFYR